MGAFRGCRPGRKHIVHQQNFASLDAFTRGNLERSANLLAPLFRIQRHLRFRKAHPQQRGNVQGYPPSNRLFDATLGGACDQFRLVESARAHPQLVHRHGNQKQLRNVDIAFELQAGFGGKSSQRMGGLPHPLILQQMD